MNENELKVLIDKMKGGDRESFNQIFRRYYSPLTRFCVRFVGDGDQATEIVQDLFVKLWTSREKLTFNTSFESYMRGDRPLVERDLEPGGLFPTMHGRVTAPSC